jgi:thioester reductase-like protein
MSRTGKVLLTGATGFVGMEVLARYLERTDRDLTCLVRADSDTAAQARLDQVLDNLFGDRASAYAARITAIPAELTADSLGLAPERRDRIAAETDTIVHSAASVSFSMPLDEARAVNVEGTRRMLEFARLTRASGGLHRYAQVSTAYVAGTHSGRFSENDLDLGQSFRNSYEQSKFEAEQLVRTSEDELPWMILRPSIVVGDRDSGWTSAFNVLYWPLRALSVGLFRSVPAVPEAPVDVVSIDYVADAIFELCEGPSEPRQTYHLTAGTSCSTMGEIMTSACDYFRRPAPVVVPPAEFIANSDAGSDAALEAGSIYFPYFAVGAEFDNTLTRTRLSQAGIEPEPLNSYLERLLDFATRSRWGKRPIARAQAVRAAQAVARIARTPSAAVR